jgi:hypothetical protein
MGMNIQQVKLRKLMKLTMKLKNGILNVFPNKWELNLSSRSNYASMMISSSRNSEVLLMDIDLLSNFSLNQKRFASSFIIAI